MDLFIPARINTTDKYGKGIGKKEMKIVVMFVLVGIFIGAIIGMIFLKTTQTILISTCVGGGALGFLGYMLSVRTAINLSPLNFISLFYSFAKEQRIFTYKKRKEW